MITRKKNQYESGFSLMEVIVAIFIMITAIVGIMSLIAAAVASSNSSTAKLTAANLAQEGIEVVKNIRDLNYDQSTGWDSWYAGLSGITCYIAQYNSSVLNASNQIDCAGETPVLKYDAPSGLFGYTKPDSAAMTVDSQFKYRRIIIITKISDDEIKISVQITWTDRNRSGALTVEDRLWKWRSY